MMQKNALENLESDKNFHAPHPRKSKKLIGHVQARTMFFDSLKSGKLHHAWLINGPAGIGKATLAWQITKCLLNNYPSLEAFESNSRTIVTQRIEALSEPSVFLCRKQFDKARKKFTQEISVDEIRKINHFFSLSNPENLWRIVIIDSVDDLSNSAANALLKILEEPPKGGIFFLISQNKENVLPTILSRCRILTCSFLKQDEFVDIVSRLESLDQKEMDEMHLFSLTKGSISKAIDMTLNDGLKLLKNIFDIMHFESEMDRKKIWSLLDRKNYSGLTTEYTVFINELILLAIARISTALAGKNELYQLEEEKRITELYRKFDESFFPFSWIYSSLAEDFKGANQTNVDPINTLLTAFLKIEKVLLKFKAVSHRKDNHT